jgi:hypothetical protein
MRRKNGSLEIRGFKKGKSDNHRGAGDLPAGAENNTFGGVGEVGSMIREVKLIIDGTVRNLCFQSYPLHPKGCQNYGHKESCPPEAPIISDVIDLERPVYAIWTVFDFGGHIRKMKELHPDWSQRQLECCLYWQGTARKKLHEEIINRKWGFVEQLGINFYEVFTCPEAMGVNVTDTMKSIGEILEWPPVTKTYQVAIAGEIL